MTGIDSPVQAKKGKQQQDRKKSAGPVQPFSVTGEEEGPESSGRPFGTTDIREVPEAINQRMLNRMLTFSLLPVLLGFISLPLLAYVQVSHIEQLTSQCKVWHALRDSFNIFPVLSHLSEPLKVCFEQMSMGLLCDSSDIAIVEKMKPVVVAMP